MRRIDNSKAFPRRWICEPDNAHAEFVTPLHRVVRKQAGDRRDGWRWTFADLHERSGVTRELKKFAHDLRRLAEANPLPEYWLTIYSDVTWAECLHAVRRSKLEVGHYGHEIPLRLGRLDPPL